MPEPEHSGRGGARPGAGRPRNPPIQEFSGYSLSRALQQTLDHGEPSEGIERELHREEVLKRREQGAASRLGLLGSMQAAGGQSLHVPLSVLTRDLTSGPYPPASWPTAATPGGGNLVPGSLRRYSDLLSWSAVIQAGATVLESAGENIALADATALPPVEWLEEVGAITPGDPTYQQKGLVPHRIAGCVSASRMLLRQAGPSLDAFFVAEIGRAISSMIDSALLVGNPAVNPPIIRGIRHTTGIQPPINVGAGVGIDELLEAEMMVELQNLPITSLGWITSPSVKRILKSQPQFASGGDSTWTGLANPISSMSCPAGSAFYGAWEFLVLAFFGGLDVVLNPYTQSLSGQTEIVAAMYVDSTLRFPAAFGEVTFATAPTVLAEPPPPPRNNRK
jgi:hypothetical protein